MPSRNRTSAETNAIRSRALYLRGLMKEFGARLVGFDPGVTANRNGIAAGGGHGYWGEHMSFDYHEWAWLEPLLIELRELRRERERRAGK